jgi:hypothetical protein
MIYYWAITEELYDELINEAIAAMYEFVKEYEADMTNEEKLAALRNAPDLLEM